MSSLDGKYDINCRCRHCIKDYGKDLNSTPIHNGSGEDGLRDRVAKIMYKDGAIGSEVNTMVALIQSEKDKLIKELLEKEQEYFLTNRPSSGTVKAVPVIQSMINEGEK